MYQEHGQLQGTVNIVLRGDDGRVKHHKTIRNKLMKHGLAHIVGRMIDTNGNGSGASGGNINHTTPKMMRFMGIGTGKYDMTTSTDEFKGRFTKNIGYGIRQNANGTFTETTQQSDGDTWEEGVNTTAVTTFPVANLDHVDISLGLPADSSPGLSANSATGKFGGTVREGAEWRLENEVTIGAFAFVPEDGAYGAGTTKASGADQTFSTTGSSRTRFYNGRIDMGNTQPSDTVAPDGETVYYPATFAKSDEAGVRPGGGRNCQGYDGGDPAQISAYSGSTNYAFGDYATEGTGSSKVWYRSINVGTNTGNLPSASPTHWQKVGDVTNPPAGTGASNPGRGGARSSVTDLFQGSIPSEISTIGQGSNTLTNDVNNSLFGSDVRFAEGRGTTAASIAGMGRATAAGSTTTTNEGAGTVTYMFGNSSSSGADTANKQYVSTYDGIGLASGWPAQAQSGSTNGIPNTQTYTGVSTKTGNYAEQGQTHFVKEHTASGVTTEVPTFVNKKRGDRLVFIALFPKNSPSKDNAIPVVEAGIFNHWDGRPANAQIQRTGTNYIQDWTKGWHYPQTMLCRTTFAIVTKQPADSLQITWSIQFADATPDFWKQYEL